MKSNFFNFFLYLFAALGCSFYSFKGSIPPHINSVYISPVENHTIEAEASNTIKIQLDESFIRENVLKLLPLKSADSQIDVILISFSDKGPYSLRTSTICFTELFFVILFIYYYAFFTLVPNSL